MTTLVLKKQQPVIKAVPVQPSLMITMPFEPKMNTEGQLQDQLRLVAKKAEEILQSQYSNAEVKQVTDRLNLVLGTLNFHCFKKSIAVFVSASSHKVLYLELKLRESVQLNSSFEITDLLELKEQPVEYLLLVLNDRWAKTYHGNQSGFKLIKTDRPKPFPDVKQQGSYSLECRRKPVPGSLYRQIADDFNVITSAYSLPVFVIGSVRNVNYFSQMIHRSEDIVQVIYSNTDNITEPVIFQKLKPNFSRWNHIKYRYLRRQLNEADTNSRVTYGKSNVMSHLNRANSSLLMIEESYLYGADTGSVSVINSNGDIVPQSSANGTELEYMIESFLGSGGDVEVLPDGFLKDYEKIALITGRTDAMFNYNVMSEADSNGFL
jgi:hypothetical protein